MAELTEKLEATTEGKVPAIPYGTPFASLKFPHLEVSGDGGEGRYLSGRGIPEFMGNCLGPERVGGTLRVKLNAPASAVSFLYYVQDGLGLPVGDLVIVARYFSKDNEELAKSEARAHTGSYIDRLSSPPVAKKIEYLKITSNNFRYPVGHFVMTVG